MKENFFSVGYSSYLQSIDKKKETSYHFFSKFWEHKVIFSILFVMIVCIGMNFWLIYKFIYILEKGI